MHMSQCCESTTWLMRLRSSCRLRLSKIQEPQFLPLGCLAGYSSPGFYPRPLLIFYPRPLQFSLSSRPLQIPASNPLPPLHPLPSDSYPPDCPPLGLPCSTQHLSSEPVSSAPESTLCLFSLLSLRGKKLSLEFSPRAWEPERISALPPRGGRGLLWGPVDPPKPPTRDAAVGTELAWRCYSGSDSS